MAGLETQPLIEAMRVEPALVGRQLGNPAAALATRLDRPFQEALAKPFAAPVGGGTPLYRYLDFPRAAGLFSVLGRRGILLRHYEDRPTVLRVGLPGSEEEWSRLEIALEEWGKEQR